MTAADDQRDAPPDTAQLLVELEAAHGSKDDRAYILLSALLLARGDLTPAQRLAVVRGRAWARHRSSHFAGAADDWSRVIEFDPTDRSALVNRAACEYALNNYGVALDDILAAEARFGPAPADEMMWRGACRFRLNDIAGARQDLKAAVRLEPENQTTWRWLAHIAGSGDDDRETALEEITLAMAALPKSANLHHRRAGFLTALDRRTEAIEALDAAVRLEPDNIDLLMYRGELRQQVEDLQGALEDQAAVVALRADRVDGQDAYVGLLRKLGRLDEALAAADRFAEAFADWPSGHRLRADVLRDMGDVPRTLEALQAAWTAAPWEWEFGCEIGVLLRKAGDLAGAYEALDRMNRAYFTLPVGRELFEVQCELGRFKEALELAGQIVARDPQSAESHRQRARAFSAVGRVKEARLDLDTAALLDAAKPGEL